METWNRLSRAHRVFILLLLLSLVVRIAAAAAIGLRPDPSFLDTGDESEYYQQSSAILHGEYTLDVRRPIGYVAFLALLEFVTGGNFRALQFVNAAIFGLAAPLMYLLMRRLLINDLAAIVTALFVIVWPPFLYYGRTLYSETATLPLFVLFLFSIPGESRRVKDRGAWFLNGLLLGLCILFRPMFLLFCPFYVLILLVEAKHWKDVLMPTAAAFIGLLLVTLSWSLLLTLKFHVFVLVSTTGGETMIHSLNPGLIRQGYRFTTTPDGRPSWTGPGKFLPHLSDTGYLSESELALPDAQRERLVRQRALQWIAGNPGPVLYLESAKLMYMWGIYPFIFGAQTFLNVITIALLFASVLSLARFRRYWSRLVRLWVLPLFVSFTALLANGAWRYRQPGDLGLLALSALLLVSLYVSPGNPLQPASEQT